MPGAVSQGESRDEALANIAEAMCLWLEVAVEDHRAPFQRRPNSRPRVTDSLEFLAAEGWPLLVETAVVQLPAAVAA